MIAGTFAGVLAAGMLAGGGAVDTADGYWMRAAATFAPPSAFIESPAVTYEPGLVPAGSGITVRQSGDERGMTVTLAVSGLRPGHAYGAHVHQKPCGTAPTDAGGHYQHRVDPVQPSTDPAYVNPDNEVWLDFTADATGSGRAAAWHNWHFRPGEAASVVLHGEHGGAGARLACFTVPFTGRA